MPKPRKGEKRGHYVSRCVQELVDKEGLDPKHAAGKCYGMWEFYTKKRKKGKK